MRVLVLSDIHMDVNGYYLGVEDIEMMRGLVSWIRGKEVDKVLIVGDIYNNMYLSLNLLRYIEFELGIGVSFIPGNHDFWDGSFEEQMGRYISSEYNLIDKTISITDEIELVGGLGWYDYTYKPERHSVKVVKDLKQMYWSDNKYIKYDMGDDLVITEKYLGKLRERLEEVKDKRVWFMSHFVPYRDFLIYQDEVWNICNSYMGSSRVGELLDEYDNVERVFFGHTHFSFNENDFRGKTISCNPVGYVGEWGIGGIGDIEKFHQRIEDMHIIIEI